MKRLLVRPLLVVDVLWGISAAANAAACRPDGLQLALSYNSFCLMLQKTLSIPKPRGELGKNGIAALDASH